MRHSAETTHSKLLIDCDTAAALGGDVPAEQERGWKIFTQACLRAVRQSGRAPASEDLEDIVAEVGARALPDFRNFAKHGTPTIEELNRNIQRDIWRSRELPAMEAATSSYNGWNVKLSAEGNQLDSLAERDFLLKLVDRLDEHLDWALRDLSSRDHDIIVLHYQFDTAGKVLRGAILPSQPEARKKAIQRARRRFRASLVRRVEKALATKPNGCELLETFLKIVQGEEIFGLLMARVLAGL